MVFVFLVITFYYVMLFLIAQNRSALQFVRNHRGTEVANEQRRNFSPYACKKTKHTTSWSLTTVCLSKSDDWQVPINSTERAALIIAGLGEKKIVVPDIDCGLDLFYSHLTSVYPKLVNCGGFELMRCIRNSKTLEVLEPHLIQSVLALKSIIGSGRLYLRSIQTNLSTEPLEAKSAFSEVGKIIFNC